MNVVVNMRGYLDFGVFIIITLFSSFIIQKWWDPCRERLFGFVFKFCFHHSILWFLNNALAKLKISFWCFWVMETELWWHFCKYTHEGCIVRALLSPAAIFYFSPNFFFLCFGMGPRHNLLIFKFFKFKKWVPHF